MRLAIASDHNGVEKKQELIKELQQLGYEMTDCSPVNEPTDDYPDFAKKVCDAVISDQVDFGILICGTGIGMSIAANKIKGIRCARVVSENDAFLARNDNFANVIALSFREDTLKLLELIKTFVNTPNSSEERHARRVEKINLLEVPSEH